jgi:hypothetical protein
MEKAGGCKPLSTTPTGRASPGRKVCTTPRLMSFPMLADSQSQSEPKAFAAPWAIGDVVHPDVRRPGVLFRAASAEGLLPSYSNSLHVRRRSVPRFQLPRSSLLSDSAEGRKVFSERKFACVSIGGGLYFHASRLTREIPGLLTAERMTKPDGEHPREVRPSSLLIPPQ